MRDWLATCGSLWNWPSFMIISSLLASCSSLTWPIRTHQAARRSDGGQVFQARPTLHPPLRAPHLIRQNDLFAASCRSKPGAYSILPNSETGCRPNPDSQPVFRSFSNRDYSTQRLLPQSGGDEPDAEGVQHAADSRGGRRVVGPCLANFYWMKFLTRRLNFSGFSMNMK